MKIFLRVLADPGYRNAVAEELGVDQGTVSKNYSLVMNKVIEKAHVWIRFPQTRVEIQQAKDMWSEKYQFPNAVGVIDCSHIRIPKFGVFGDEYINRKGYPSINVQMTCNARESFTSVDCQWPGSVHDNRIFKNSAIYNVLKYSVEECLILGDEGYSITPWTMTPYRNQGTAAQRAYDNRAMLWTNTKCVLNLKKYLQPSYLVLCCTISQNG
ncbi:hypothetical protein NQ315_014033 [Exocentrus adspersus]|uniref:Putative nuclease HARBI1 n=1 Tax=Exocentrus adspersus TaxID=1586481 RepID=A0AAV8VC40_9CUCU|nr:hypothetical protein NQ315_014033 [Exocentrus adspersus]